MRYYQLSLLAIALVLSACGATAPPSAGKAPTATVASPTGDSQAERPSSYPTTMTPAATPTSPTPAILASPTEQADPTTIAAPLPTDSAPSAVPASTAAPQATLDTANTTAPVEGAVRADQRPALIPPATGSVERLQVRLPLTSVQVVAVVPRYPSKPTIVLGGGDGLFLSRDDGASWTKRADGSIHDIAFAPDDADPLIFALMSTKDDMLAVLRSRDGGSQWAMHPLPGFGGCCIALATLLVSPTFADDQTLFVLGADLSSSNQVGAVFRSSDAGTTWSKLASPCTVATRLALSPTYAQDRTLLLVCAATGGAESSSNGIYRSTDGGTGWKRLLSGPVPSEFSPAFNEMLRTGTVAATPTPVSSVATTSRCAPSYGRSTRATRPDGAVVVFAIATCLEGGVTQLQVIRTSPATTNPLPVLDLDSTPVAIAVAGRGAQNGDTLVVAQGTRLWRIRLAP